MKTLKNNLNATTIIYKKKGQTKPFRGSMHGEMQNYSDRLHEFEIGLVNVFVKKN